MIQNSLWNVSVRRKTILPLMTYMKAGKVVLMNDINLSSTVFLLRCYKYVFLYKLRYIFYDNDNKLYLIQFKIQPNAAHQAVLLLIFYNTYVQQQGLVHT